MIKVRSDPWPLLNEVRDPPTLSITWGRHETMAGGKKELDFAFGFLMSQEKQLS